MDIMDNPDESFDVNSGIIDSVENGQAGHDHWASGSITYTFDAGVLGALPDAVSIVWTDGVNPITFEAFDEFGNSLGTVVGAHAFQRARTHHPSASRLRLRRSRLCSPPQSALSNESRNRTPPAWRGFRLCCDSRASVNALRGTGSLLPGFSWHRRKGPLRAEPGRSWRVKATSGALTVPP